MTGKTKTIGYIRHIYKVTNEVKSYKVYLIDEVKNGNLQLTEILRIEKYNNKSNATNIEEYLTLRTTTNWNTSERVTGLRPTNKKDIFYGDRLEKVTKKRTLLIFQLSKDSKELTIDVYRGFYPNNKGILHGIIKTY